jgi:hypothetical protein
MIELIRGGREELIGQFGCSRRLAARMGALQAKGFTFSATLAEEAKPGSKLEKLLLKKELLDCVDLPTALAQLLQTEEFAELDFPLTTIEQDGLTVIAAEEETLAEEGWSSEPKANALALASPAAVSPISPPASPFTAEEVMRLRVNIFAANTSQDKVAALRQFSFAGISAEEKAGVCLQALADPDRSLRAASAQALRQLGLNPDLSETARLLAEGNDRERNSALERLGDFAATGNSLDLDAVLMALLGGLRDAENNIETRTQIMETLAQNGGRLGAARLCRDDILRVVLEQANGAPDDLRRAARKILGVLEQLTPGWALAILLAEIAQTGSDDYRRGLLELVSALPLNDADRKKLAPVALKTVEQTPTDTEACRLIAGFVLSCGEEAVCLLAERMPEMDNAHQRHFVRLFDNLPHSRRLTLKEKSALAAASLRMLENSPKQVRVDIIETSVCRAEGLPEETGASLARALLRDLRDYSHWPLSETMENTLSHLGAGAVEPLQQALQEHRGNAAAAAVVAGALGKIGAEISTAADPALVKKAEDILRALQTLTFSDPACRDSLNLALGKICASSGVSGEIGGLIIRSLLNRLEGKPSDAATIKALGYACRGNGADDNRLRTVAGLAMKHLQNEHPDPTVEVDSVNGEEIFRLGGELGMYSELIPACISALENVALAALCPDDLREEILQSLLEDWQAALANDQAWGPANVALLTASLGRAGAAENLPLPLRERIAQTLARRVGEVSVLAALSGILARGDKSALFDRMAGAVVLRLLKIIDQAEDLTTEDHEAYLRILGKTALRGSFEIRGGSEERLIERMLEAIFRGLHQAVPGCLQHLRALNATAKLPARHLEKISAELKRFSALTVR